MNKIRLTEREQNLVSWILVLITLCGIYAIAMHLGR